MIDILKNIYYLLPLLVSFPAILSGYILLKKKPSHLIKQLFFILCISTSFIFLIYLASLIPQTQTGFSSFLYWLSVFVLISIIYISPSVLRPSYMGFVFAPPIQLAWIGVGLCPIFSNLTPFHTYFTGLFMVLYLGEQSWIMYSCYKLKSEIPPFYAQYIRQLMLANGVFFPFIIYDILRVSQLVIYPESGLPLFFYSIYHTLQCGFIIYQATRYLFFREALTGIETVAPSLDFRNLTGRETEIVKFVLHGLTNKEIGQELFIAEDTVKKHLKKIYRKYNIKTRFELIKHFNK